jgi:type I restriction enzyme S subunit
MTWAVLELQNVCALITDGAHNSPKSVEDGLPMASVKDLTPFGINLNTSRLISKEDFDRLVKMNCHPIKGDVLIAKDGASALDTICELKQDIDVVLLSSIAILRPNTNKVTSSFLRYYLDSPPTRSYMKSGFVTGAAIPRVVLEDFKRIKIKIPPIDTQNKITGILSAYDDLIENNTRRIKILEEMAQLIYRQWFVEFKFPGHEGVRMVDSGTELGEVPEGWEVIPYSELLESFLGGDWGSEEATEKENHEVVVIRGTDFNSIKNGGDIKAPTRNISSNSKLKRQLKEGDIVIENSVNASSRCIGSSLLITNGILRLIGSQLICASFCKNFRLKNPNLSPLVYLHMKYLYDTEKMAYYQHVATNGIGNFQAKRFVESEMITLPQDKELLEKMLSVFHDITTSIYMEKIANLRTTRDFLLPKLISGEVDVSEVEVVQ